MPRILRSRPLYDESAEKWFFTLVDGEQTRHHMSPSLYSNEKDADVAATQFLKIDMQGRFSHGS